MNNTVTDLREVLPLYLGCKAVANLSRYVSGTGKNYPLGHVPVIFDSINKNKDIDQCWGVTVDDENGLEFYDVFDKKCRIWEHFVHSTEIKPVLRRFSSMTEEECVAVATIEGLTMPIVTMREGVNEIVDDSYCMAISHEGQILLIKRGNVQRLTKIYEIVKYLLSKHFDLFGLIERGLALDAARLRRLENVSESKTLAGIAKKRLIINIECHNVLAGTDGKCVVTAEGEEYKGIVVSGETIGQAIAELGISVHVMDLRRNENKQKL